MVRLTGGKQKVLRQVVMLSIFVVLGLFFWWMTTQGVFAEGLKIEETGVEDFAASGVNTQLSLTIIIARIIRAFFGLLGIVAVGYFVYGGALWMTAGGDATKVESAKKLMINAVIGMAIMLSSFAIASFIISALLGGVNGSSGGYGSGGVTPPSFVGGGALGKAIEYVLPEPGAKDVYRDTAIVVQFKERIVVDSVLDNATQTEEGIWEGVLDVSSVMIYKQDEGQASALSSNQVKAIINETTQTVGGNEKVLSLLTVVLQPPNLLGNPQNNTDYTVLLGPQILKYNEAGSEVPLFASIKGYEWDFEVGTEVDLYPAEITSVYPSADSEDNFRNVTVLVNFNKSMMPSTILSGSFMSVRNVATQTLIEGEWTISNLARTAEFRTKLACGKSACGDPYYCFDPNIDVEITVDPGNIDTDIGAPKARIPFDGVVSLTGNSVDGDRDGVAEGQAVYAEDGGAVDLRDTVVWQFGVGPAMDVTGPRITLISPKALAENVSTQIPINVRFDEVVLPSSGSYAYLYQPEKLEQWYYPRTYMLDASGTEIVDGGVPVLSSISLMHAPFIESSKQFVYSYMPSYTHGIKDAQNNCFVPAAGPGCTYDEGDLTKPYCCNGNKQDTGDFCANSYKALPGN